MERQLHKDAMQFYYENFNNVVVGEGTENNTLNRNTIKRIKKLIVNEREEYTSLRVKYLNETNNTNKTGEMD